MVASYVDIGDCLDSFVGPLEGYNTAGKMQRQASNMSLASVSAAAAGCAEVSASEPDRGAEPIARSRRVLYVRASSKAPSAA